MCNKKIVTVLVPNYKTLKLTKVCLRLIKKNTDLNKVHVIVIDNDSRDDSTKYLRSLNWIELIERKGVNGEGGPMSHARALDLALTKVTTPFVIAIHTDTFVIHPNWLNILLQPFENKNVGGVGSWKLEIDGFLKILGKKIEYFFKLLLNKKINRQRFDKNYHYIRSHCAAYRVRYIKSVKSSFSDKNESAGKVLHEKMKQAGYEMIFLKSDHLNKYVNHINHATQAINAKFNIRSAGKSLKNYFSYMNKKEIIDILKDDRLDH